MKRTGIVLILIGCVSLVGLPFSSLLAEDFSFIGITWNDDLAAVQEKIDRSGLSTDKRWSLVHTEPTPLNSIFKDSTIDEEKSKELARISDNIRKDLRIERQVKFIEFRGKGDSNVKNASFFFAYDRDVLLAYSVSLKTPDGTSAGRADEGGFYQALVKQYGPPTGTPTGSKVWSQKGQTLYFTVVHDAAVVTYISDLNLSGYIDRLGGKAKKPDPVPSDTMLPGPRITY